MQKFTFQAFYVLLTFFLSNIKNLLLIKALRYEDIWQCESTATKVFYFSTRWR